MKKIVTTICLIATAFGAVAEKKSDARAANIKGNVKKMTTTFYRVHGKSGGKLDKSMVNKYVNTYDAQGTCKEMLIYDHLGKLNAKCVPKNDPAANIESLVYYTSAGKMDRKTLRTVDLAAHKGDLKMFNGANKIESHYIETLDEKGNVLESDMVDATGKTIHKFAFKYDDSSNKSLITSILTDGSIESTEMNVYNENNEVVDWVIDDKANGGQRSNHYIFEYKDIDAKGNWQTKNQIKVSTKEIEQITTRKLEYFPN